MMDVRKMSIDKVFKGHTREITSKNFIAATTLLAYLFRFIMASYCSWHILFG